MKFVIRKDTDNSCFKKAHNENIKERFQMMVVLKSDFAKLLKSQCLSW